MKKQYINPEMLIVKVGTVELLTGSKMGFGDPATTIDAPEYDWDEDEFEEY